MEAWSKFGLMEAQKLIIWDAQEEPLSNDQENFSLLVCLGQTTCLAMLLLYTMLICSL